MLPHPEPGAGNRRIDRLRNNLRQIGEATHLYAADFNGYVPNSPFYYYNYGGWCGYLAGLTVFVTNPNGSGADTGKVMPAASLSRWATFYIKTGTYDTWAVRPT